MRHLQLFKNLKPNEYSNSNSSNIKALHIILIGKLPKLVSNGRDSPIHEGDETVFHTTDKWLAISQSHHLLPSIFPLPILHNTPNTRHNSPVQKDSLKWTVVLGYTTFLPPVHRITMQTETCSLWELSTVPRSAVVRMEKDPRHSLLPPPQNLLENKVCTSHAQETPSLPCALHIYGMVQDIELHVWALGFSTTSERPIANARFFIQCWVDFTTGLLKKSILPMADIWIASK